MTRVILAVLVQFSTWVSAAEVPKLTFGGQLRTRAESTDIQSYSTPGLRRGQDQFLLRSRLHLGVDAQEQKLKGFIQIQDSRTAGQEAPSPPTPTETSA